MKKLIVGRILGKLKSRIQCSGLMKFVEQGDITHLVSRIASVSNVQHSRIISTSILMSLRILY
jgi:hypothetical protein